MRTPVRTLAALGLAILVLLGVVAWIITRDDGVSSPTASGVTASASVEPSPSAGKTPSLGSARVTSTVTGIPPSSTAVAPASRGGFPDASTTGISAGVQLKAAITKPLRITKPGTVIDGADLRADISVEADNVVIRNTRIVNAGTWGIIQRENAKGLLVQNCEIRGDGTAQLQHAVFNLGGMITVRRTDMSVVSDAISTSVGLIEDNYLHDPKYFPGDHTDMIQANSGPPPGQQIVIRHNTVINTLDQTAAVALFQDFGVQHDAVIENNLLAGGGYALYAGAGRMGTSYNINVIGNVFSREVYPRGGQYGPVSYWDAHGSGNEWRGNVWADTRKPVTP